MRADRSITGTRTAWVLGIGAGLLVALAARPAIASDTPGNRDADSASAEQKIYLDPNTGKVVSSAPADSSQSNDTGSTGERLDSSDENDDQAEDQSRDQEKTSRSRYTPWKTKDGVQMLAVHPENDPAERIVRCADGSLRMGQVQTGSDEADADDAESSADDDALCSTGGE